MHSSYLHWPTLRELIEPYSYRAIIFSVREILLDIQKRLDNLRGRDRFVERKAKRDAGQVLESIDDRFHIVDVLDADFQMLNGRRDQ